MGETLLIKAVHGNRKTSWAGGSLVRVMDKPPCWMPALLLPGRSGDRRSVKARTAHEEISAAIRPYSAGRIL
jgi:hypothetical protein